MKMEKVAHFTTIQLFVPQLALLEELTAIEAKIVEELFRLNQIIFGYNQT